MTIVHVILRARYSGAEIVARDLALHQRARGNNVSIISVETGEQAFSPEIGRMRSGGVGYFSPARQTKGVAGRVLYLRSILKGLRPELVVAHSILPSIYSRCIRATGQRFRLATVLHCNSDFDSFKLRWTERALRSLHDSVIGVSHEACEKYRTLIGSQPKTTFIPNGIELNSFSFDERVRAQTRREIFAIDDSTSVILQIGRICEQKQQLLTLRALQDLDGRLGNGSKLKVVFVGTTEAQKYMDTFLSALKQQTSNMEVAYFGPRSDVHKLLMGCDLLLMPSGWEGHSIAAIEAAASGVPMVVSDIPAFTELVGLPGVFSFRTGDRTALLEAIRRGLQVESGRRFERNLQDFSIDRCSESYMRTLRIPGADYRHHLQ